MSVTAYEINLSVTFLPNTIKTRPIHFQFHPIPSVSSSTPPDLWPVTTIAMNRFFLSSWTRLHPTINRRIHSFLLPTYYRPFSQFAGDDDVDPEPDSWRSMEGLVRCSANHAPLSPITFLERAAKVYRDTTSVVYGSYKYTWSQTHQRCLKLASALSSQVGISRGDVVTFALYHISCFLFFLFILFGYFLSLDGCFHGDEILIALHALLIKHKALLIDYLGGGDVGWILESKLICWNFIFSTLYLLL